MREALVGAAILILTVGAAVRAQDQPSPLDAPTALRLPATLPACGVNTVLLALARTSHVATGFEESPDESRDCSGRFARVDVSYEQSSLTVRQVLDQLIALAPDYQWTEMNGVAVVRPVAAWANGEDVLNARVGPLHLTDATVGDTLATILRRPAPRDDRVSRLNFGKPPFAVAFDGGTMVEALNVLVRSRGDAGWTARVLHASGADGTPALQLSIRTFRVGDRTGVDGALSMGMPISRLIATR
ncbi:MAG TPA: hypothetical protein VLV86_00370 [Vicinamibacterales bacterium]|nr:hypothetical protein [Vicinamibacterales bacterium]